MQNVAYPSSWEMLAEFLQHCIDFDEVASADIHVVMFVIFLKFAQYLNIVQEIRWAMLCQL